MPTFNDYPSSRIETFDLPAILEQAQRRKSAQTHSRLEEMQLQSAQGEAQRQNQLRGIMPGVGAEAGLGPNAQQVLAIDPSMMSELLKIPKAKRDQAKAEMERIGNLLQAVETAPGVQRPNMYAMVRQQYAASGADLSGIPETYDPAWVQTKLAEAGKFMAVLDQVPDTPSGYQRSDAGLEFTPGGPADPAQVGRLTEAKSQGGGLTVAQQRENAEIEQARKALDREGLSHEDVMRIAKSQKDTGRDNPEYNPLINSRVRQATRRKYGDDPDYAATYGRYLTPSPEFSDPAGPKALPPGVSAEQPGVLDRIGDFLGFGGDDTPAPAPGGAPRRGTPRAGGRGGPRGRSGAKTIPSMSAAEIKDLVDTKGKSLTPAERKKIQVRLDALGL